LRTEVYHLSKTDAEDAQSIAGFTEVSIHEAIREEKNPQLLKLSFEGAFYLCEKLREFPS